ncbi:MAG: helix-turn-helix transcriptional regulator [Bacillota bacterium]|nr:helix-turn-helix transcriptional regulator [Bacillota bacterium]
MRKALNEARKMKGLSVSQIAQELGISASFYYKIEQGSRNPTIGLASKLSQLLARPIDVLFAAEDLDETSRSTDDQAATLESA